jgi:allantoate deiminase
MHMSVQRTVDLARQAVDRCLALASLSEEKGRTTRTFLSRPMKEAHRLVRGWMEEAGLAVVVDAIGNIRGARRGTRSDAPTLLMGSHLDTVPGAGAFDGMLGIMMALAVVQGSQTEFGVEIIAFSEEEGVRFGVPFLGSKAVTGTLDRAVLQRQDADGISVAQAIRDFGLDPNAIENAEFQSEALGYVEFHIEQGPVLDSLNAPVGVVEAIVGQSRLEVTFHGKTNHAGTTPMHLRRDALTAASEWVLKVEQIACSTPGLVATVGRIAADPGAANVIPGEVRATLDVRHHNDSIRTASVSRILEWADAITAQRQLRFTSKLLQEQSAALCHPELTDILANCVESAGLPVHRMVSGAGHDAMIMAARMPIAMLFVRSPGGVSHHSDESVRVEDVAAGLDAGLEFIKQLGTHYASIGTH